MRPTDQVDGGQWWRTWDVTKITVLDISDRTAPTLLREVFQFAREYKAYWLVPFILVLYGVMFFITIFFYKEPPREIERTTGQPPPKPP